MSRALIYCGEAWPVLYVSSEVHELKSSRTAYDVDAASLARYHKAQRELLKAERELLESIDHTNPDQLMESEMRMYLDNLPKDGET